MGIGGEEHTAAERARVRTKARYLLVPVTAELDAGVEGLDCVATFATPVDIFANIDASDSPCERL